MASSDAVPETILLGPRHLFENWALPSRMSELNTVLQVLNEGILLLYRIRTIAGLFSKERLLLLLSGKDRDFKKLIVVRKDKALIFSRKCHLNPEVQVLPVGP